MDGKLAEPRHGRDLGLPRRGGNIPGTRAVNHALAKRNRNDDGRRLRLGDAT